MTHPADPPKRHPEHPQASPPDNDYMPWLSLAGLLLAAVLVCTGMCMAM